MKSRLLHIIKYLFFGVATTAVSWVVYFGAMLCGRWLFGIDSEDVSSAAYIGLYTAAQILQWTAAVLVAFFTNRKWVFTDRDKKQSTVKQLGVFAGGRVLTLGLDYVITYFGTLGLCALIPTWSSVMLFGREWNLNEICAKLAAAVIVVVVNYFVSRLLVFKKEKKEKKEN